MLQSNSKCFQNQWNDKYYNEHRKRVEEVRPQVDCRPPRAFMHLHLSIKKLQDEERRLVRVEKENRQLLERMATIMKTHGKVDNRNDFEKYDFGRANREARMRELLRVTKGNKEILRRINDRQPEYSRKKWEEDWQRNLKAMDHMSNFRKDWWKTSAQTPDSKQQKAKGVKKNREEETERETSVKEREDKEKSKEHNRERSSEATNEQRREKTPHKKDKDDEKNKSDAHLEEKSDKTEQTLERRPRTREKTREEIKKN